MSKTPCHFVTTHHERRSGRIASAVSTHSSCRNGGRGNRDEKRIPNPPLFRPTQLSDHSPRRSSGQRPQLEVYFGRKQARRNRWSYCDRRKYTGVSTCRQACGMRLGNCFSIGPSRIITRQMHLRNVRETKVQFEIRSLVALHGT